MNNLTLAPPLFTDYSLSELHSTRHELKENLRLCAKNGRCLLQKPVFKNNLRLVNNEIGRRSLKANA